MRCGKPLVIVCGDEFPDFHERYKIDEKYGITWAEILQWEPFRNKEQYMKVVKDGENYDTTVTKGKFAMQEDFNIIFMAKYVREDDYYQMLEGLPNS